MISIITCCYSDKRIQELKKLINSVTIQTMPCELLIVVEKDWNLVDMIQEYSSVPRVIFHPEAIGLARARNLGIENASGDIIAFADDDCRLDRYWSAHLEIAFHTQNCIGIAGKIIPDWERITDSNYPKSLYWAIGCDISDEPKERVFGHGTNMAFRKAALTERFTEVTHGGKVKKGLVGDDTDLQLRLSGNVIYDPRIVVYHFVSHHKTTLSYLLHYSFWQGRTEKRFKQLYGDKRKREVKKELSIKTMLALVAGGIGYVTN